MNERNPIHPFVAFVVFHFDPDGAAAGVIPDTQIFADAGQAFARAWAVRQGYGGDVLVWPWTPDKPIPADMLLGAEIPVPVKDAFRNVLEAAKVHLDKYGYENIGWPGK